MEFFPPFHTDPRDNTNNSKPVFDQQATGKLLGVKVAGGSEMQLHSVTPGNMKQIFLLADYKMYMKEGPFIEDSY